MGCGVPARAYGQAPQEETPARLGRAPSSSSSQDKILSKMGEGTFGQVLECLDLEKIETVAIKIVRSLQKYREAAMIEIDVLQRLAKADISGTCYVQIRNWFDYRNHICIVFEKLGPSLYDFLCQNSYRSFPIGLVRELGRQLLDSVAFVHDLRLIHTDLKPENILLVSSECIKVPDYKFLTRSRKDGSFFKNLRKSSAIKLIDFGSTTFEHQDHSYVVSTRHYHAPEVILGTGDVVAEYYQQQVEMLEGFNEMDALADRGFLPRMSKEEREKVARSERMAIRISNVANMVLFAAKVYASIRSGSLAIIASTLDSLLDLLSGFILWFTAFSMQTPNPYQYPIGKRRMQPLGILVFASVMATLGLQIILESVRSLISGEDVFSLTKEQEAWVVNIMLGVTLVKLVLVVYCRSFTNEIVKAYAQDHFFDVITNVIGLVAALLANYVKDWIDPVGAIILALYTIRTWSMTVLENVNSLVGRSAAPEYLQKLTYLCWNHHRAIRHIDTVRAYTFGSHYFVEVDIVLPSDMPLKEAHDIGEALQEKLELLPDIERAFVHLDYEFTHRPEHAQAHDS